MQGPRGTPPRRVAADFEWGLGVTQTCLLSSPAPSLAKPVFFISEKRGEYPPYG